MRRQVYRHIDEFLKPEDCILDINAGTGIDAVHFAQNGYPVFAIDNAEGMLDELKKKVHRFRLKEKIQFAHCSFTDLDSLPENRFDHVFSNFGGLNCISDLRLVTRALPRFLKSGGMVTFVVMPRVCPWELLHVVSGNSKMAFRRFSRHGAPASVEGNTFLTYYFSPMEVAQSFSDAFKLVKIRGLASFSPPPYMEGFVKKYPRTYKVLTQLDEQCSAFPPFNRWADHCIITMKYVP